MPRATIDDVRDKADFTLSDDEIQAFIEDAADFIDARMTDATTAEKTLVEPWVAAHLASMKDPSVRVAKSRIGPSSIEYEGSYDGELLESTRFGQTAILLDPTGTLQSTASGSVFHYTVNTRED